MSDSLKTALSPPQLIHSYQKDCYEKLLDLANTCFGVARKTLPIRLRTNTLIIGPSGSGKTFLAAAAAKELGVPFLSLTISEWILLGTNQRGAVTTWPSIVKFLNMHKQAPGVLIFLDEVDKVGGDTSWEMFLRAEVFRLLDLQIPTGLLDAHDEIFSNSDNAMAQEVLSNRTLLVAAGAFQHIWEGRVRPSLGFGSSNAHGMGDTTLSELVRTLPKELVNRFRADLLILPMLTESDYLVMLERTVTKIPIYLRETFLRLGQERIMEVARLQQGGRFLEELMTDTILVERAKLKKLPEMPEWSLESEFKL